MDEEAMLTLDRTDIRTDVFPGAVVHTGNSRY